jgi:predicted transcriptional regulator
MKTQTIEIDNETATALRQRAEERGVTVPELVAELVAAEAGRTEADLDNIAELDRRWRAFGAQDSVASNEEVVRWLQTWLQTWGPRHSGPGVADESLNGRTRRLPTLTDLSNF